MTQQYHGSNVSYDRDYDGYYDDYWCDSINTYRGNNRDYGYQIRSSYDYPSRDRNYIIDISRYLTPLIRDSVLQIKNDELEQKYKELEAKYAELEQNTKKLEELLAKATSTTDLAVKQATNSEIAQLQQTNTKLVDECKSLKRKFVDEKSDESNKKLHLSS
jgi:hypothetical protein